MGRQSRLVALPAPVPAYGQSSQMSWMSQYQEPPGQYVMQWYSEPQGTCAEQFPLLNCWRIGDSSGLTPAGRPPFWPP